MAQGIVIDAVFVAAADAEHARFDDLAQPMADARRIAPVPQGSSKRARTQVFFSAPRSSMPASDDWLPPLKSL